MPKQNRIIPYLSDLSDRDWNIIKPYFPNPDTNRGIKRSFLSRNIEFHILFLRSDCAWRMLPHQFAHWKTVDV